MSLLYILWLSCKRLPPPPTLHRRRESTEDSRGDPPKGSSVVGQEHGSCWATLNGCVSDCVIVVCLSNFIFILLLIYVCHLVGITTRIDILFVGIWSLFTPFPSSIYLTILHQQKPNLPWTSCFHCDNPSPVHIWSNNSSCSQGPESNTSCGWNRPKLIALWTNSDLYANYRAGIIN